MVIKVKKNEVAEGDRELKHRIGDKLVVIQILESIRKGGQEKGGGERASIGRGGNSLCKWFDFRRVETQYDKREERT